MLPLRRLREEFRWDRRTREDSRVRGPGKERPGLAQDVRDGLVREEPLSLLLAFPLGSHEGLEMETVRAQNVDRDVGRVPQYC